MQSAGISASAMSAYSLDMQVRANNVANVDSLGFEAGRMNFADGPGGQGVMPAGITTDTSPGPMVPGLVSMTDNGRERLVAGSVEGSNTDLGREMTGMITTRMAFDANAAVFQSVDDVTGMIVQLKA